MASSANRHNDDHPHPFTMMQAFEWYTPGGGTQWKWLAENAARFSDIGITALWLPPPCKTASRESTGYDIYDLWDLGEFEHPRDTGQESARRTKYGTRQELEQCMRALRENKISIYIDAVLNHKMGADKTQVFNAVQVDENNRTKAIGEPHDIEAWTQFTFPGRNGKLSSFEWGFEHFTGVDWDQKSQTKGVFRILGDNKNWAQDVDKENINYDYLMGADVEHAHPDVKKDLLAWGKWMIDTFPISGFRFDAVKHISREFIHEFVKHTRQSAREKRKRDGLSTADEESGPLTFAVGEFWKDSLDSCLKYLDEFGDEQFSLFDAPLHYNFKEAGDQGKNYDIRKIFDGTIVQSRPVDAVTLVENHDTQSGQSLASPVPPTFKPLAYALILMREEGYPCVFLGDLDGTHGDESSGQPAAEPIADLAKIIKARKYLSRGEQRDYWDHPQCVGWVRVGDSQSDASNGCAVVICIGEKEGTKRMQTTSKPGDVWTDILEWHKGTVTIEEDGWATFFCPPQSCSIWASQETKKFYGL